jgi:selenobiotic family peptide radical SAM maturase
MDKGVRAFDDIYKACSKIIGPERLHEILKDVEAVPEPEALTEILHVKGETGIPEYISDLALLEWSINKVTQYGSVDTPHEEIITINPTLHLLELSWKNLLSLIDQRTTISGYSPVPGKEFLIIWKGPKTGKTFYRRASHGDLLALKIIFEKLSAENISNEEEVSLGTIDAIVDHAIKDGILLAPPSKLNRDPAVFSSNEYVDQRFLASRSFTLQWHITQSCDLHCKHCYDRSNRSNMALEDAIKVLDDLHAFCKSKNVMGSISFTGGNPLMYPHFKDLYREASKRNFTISILGNPASREYIKEIASIQKPSLFQLSLEGLPEHNDFIRGRGHFERVVEFLATLRDMNIFSMIMLTLTDRNMKDILPLGEILKDKVDRFHFNRLSMVGEGSNLRLPERSEYIAFLESYIKATEKNRILGLKDNMFSILHYRNKVKPFGGCTTYGCGAAFNFLAVLSDGEVHACRKFPSPLGNIFKQTFSDIYDSDIAKRYRTGCEECRSCVLRPVCGGCLAVSHSFGLDIFKDKDPFCFMHDTSY